MGAWGAGSFDNDMANDWLEQFIEGTSDAQLESALVFDCESDRCCCAIAAAEVVAALRGNPLRGLPEEFKEWLAEQDREAGEPLVQQAIATVEHILEHSELRDLWETAAKWRSKCEALLTRLRMAPRARRRVKKQASPFNPLADTPKNASHVAQLFKQLGVIPTSSKGRVTNLLAMSNDAIEDQHLSYLNLMPHLEAITLKECRNLSPAGLAHVGRLPNLQRVDLTGTKIGEEFVKALAERSQITQLILTRTAFRNDWLHYLTSFSNLDMLELDGNEITDDGCQTIARVTSLTTLYLNETNISTQGVSWLRHLPRLAMLGLFGTAVDDSVVPILREMKQLHEIQLRKSRVTREAVKELRRSRPDLKVYM